jgi:methylglutaconyl-CoA hydratase
MGAGRARRVFMSARIFDAAEAVELGLLAKAVAADDLDAAVEAEVAPYLNCAPGAVARAKALVAALEPRVNDAVVDMTIAALVEAWESDEGPEGVSAFFEKRKPRWQQG